MTKNLWHRWELWPRCGRDCGSRKSETAKLHWEKISADNAGVTRRLILGAAYRLLKIQRTGAFEIASCTKRF